MLLTEVSIDHPVVGRLEPYGDCGFFSFETDTMAGLTRVSGDRVEFLSLLARERGRGHFEQFLKDLRGVYHEIVVWELVNPRFERWLRRRKFVSIGRIEKGELILGVVWRRPPTVTCG